MPFVIGQVQRIAVGQIDAQHALRNAVVPADEIKAAVQISTPHEMASISALIVLPGPVGRLGIAERTTWPEPGQDAE